MYQTVLDRRNGTLSKSFVITQLSHQKSWGEKNMLWTIILILLVLWALGFGFAGAQVGSLIHILLVIAVIVLVIQLVTGRRSI